MHLVPYIKILSFAWLLMMFTVIKGSAQTNNYFVWDGYSQYNSNNYQEFSQALNFKNEPPTLEKGNKMHPIETDICDSTGNMLFYGGWRTYFNAAQQLIPGSCAYPATQQTYCADHQGNNIALPNPSIQGQYYVFEISSGKYLQYNIIDFRNLNGGSFTADQPVYSFKDSISILNAVKNENNDGYWITVQTFDTLYAFPFNKNGIGPPVKSYLGPLTHFTWKYTADWPVPSHDGRLFVAIHNKIADDVTDSGSFVYAYDFDLQTGKFNNERLVLDYRNSQKRNEIMLFEGIAFSPNDSFFYAITGNFNVDSLNDMVFQCGRFVKDFSPLLIQTGGHSGYYGFGGIYTGPNGKIYIIHASEPSISIIKYPDRQGDGCQFKSSYLHYPWPAKPANQMYALSFLRVLDNYHPLKFEYKQGCPNGHFIVNIDSIFKTRKWYVNNIEVGNINSGFTKTGTYYVKLQGITKTGYSAWYSDSILYIAPPKANFGYSNQTGCQWVGFQFLDSSTCDTFNQSIGKSWAWDFGDGSTSNARNPNHIYSKSGAYSVRLIFSNGFCTDTFIKTQVVNILPAPKPGFSVSDTVGCVPLKIDVKDGSMGSVVKWLYVIKKIHPQPPPAGDSSTLSSFGYVFSEPGQYVIHQYLTGTTGCITEDSVMINVTPVFTENEKVDIDYATVDSTGNIQIKWPGFPGATNYSLFRYTDKDTSAALLATKTTDTFYSDYNNIDPNNHTYTYFVKGEDGCGHLTGSGLIGNTIKLSGFLDQNLTPSLSWNPYFKWQNGVKEYEVYRQESGAEFKLLSTTSTAFYLDTSSMAYNTFGECYKVLAISNLSTQTGNNPFISTSNIYCFSEKPQIYIPNIFTPNGDTLNDYFAPVCMGIKKYSMTIINRWGEKIYESSLDAGSLPQVGHIAEGPGTFGWDGTFKGLISPNGVYVYYIKAEDYNGHVLTRQGMIMLQR